MNLFKNIPFNDTLKKEIARYAVSFFSAWLVSALISDFPFFKQLFIQRIGLDVAFTHLHVSATKDILTLMGFSVITQGNFLQIVGTPGVIFEYGCLGFRELAFFSVFILFQYGAFKHKAWYIPAGIVLLIVLNIVRVVIICLGQYQNEAQTDMIHDIVSPIIMYPAILFLWIFWITKFGKPPVHDTLPERLFKKGLSIFFRG